MHSLVTIILDLNAVILAQASSWIHATLEKGSNDL